MAAEHLEALGRAFASLDRRPSGRLRPGLPADVVRAKLGADVPDEVVEWFAWCDGAEPASDVIDDSVALIPWYEPLALDAALALVSVYEGDEVLEPHFVPLMSDAGGNDIVAAVWDGPDGVAVAEVLTEDDSTIAFTSIRQMAAVHVACYERGVYRLGADGRLERTDGYDEVREEITGRVA